MDLRSLVSFFAALILASGAAAQSISALPGHYYHAQAEDALKRGQYDRAMEFFELSAWWGDKLSQFNVGVMYFNGQGVEADPVRGWAWVALSAERGYRRMEDAASQIWSSLDGDQRMQAEQLYEELLASHGDAVAVPRAQQRMDREKRRITGSRTGFVGAMSVLTPDGRTLRGDQYHDARFYDFAALKEEEMQVMEALDRARVRFGEFRVIEDAQPR